MTDILEREQDLVVETFDLAGSASHLIHRAQQFAADRYAEALAEETITQRQFAVLNAVAANEGLTQTQLVRATGIDRSTLAELVARMAERRLIIRERAMADARANTVRLTEHGRTALERALPHVSAADDAIMHALPKAKRAAFIDALQRIARVLDEPPQPEAPTVKAKKEKKKVKKAEKPKAVKEKTVKEKAVKAEKPKKPAKASKKTTDKKKAK